jgi:hypothetical protein
MGISLSEAANPARAGQPPASQGLILLTEILLMTLSNEQPSRTLVVESNNHVGKAQSLWRRVWAATGFRTFRAALLRALAPWPI